jgi:superfamily II DNA or RNA helicase
MAHVNVITAGQLERIRAKVREAEALRWEEGCTMSSRPKKFLPMQVITVSDETRKEEERLRLKTLSEERASKWPNTLQVQQCQHCCYAAQLSVIAPHFTTLHVLLQAARARKERARQEKLAAEEAEREEVRQHAAAHDRRIRSWSSCFCSSR